MPQGRIRVLQVVDSLTLGGAERVVTMLSIHSNRTRFEIIPCAVKDSGPLEEDLLRNHVNYRVLGIKRRSILTGPRFVADFLRLLRALSGLCREFSVDIIHAHLTENALLALLAARRGGGPRVCASVHSVVFSTQRGRFSPRKWAMRKAIDEAFSRADRIIVVSDEVRRAVQLCSHIPEGRIVTIPNGVEANPFQADQDRFTLRRRLGLPIDRPIVVSVGRLIPVKGYPCLQRALALIPAGQRPLSLVVGDGPDRKELESTASGMGLSTDMQFLGCRRDVPVLLAAADIFVLSSLWEGLPLALLEAMAAGLPAVVTAVGGNPEVIEDGKSGLLVPAGNELALSKALSSLLGNPLQRERMGKAAKDRFDQHFSLRRFVEAHETLYEEMLAGPSLATVTHKAERVQSLG